MLKRKKPLDGRTWLIRQVPRDWDKRDEREELTRAVLREIDRRMQEEIDDLGD